ncbi:hypothetical protein GFK82_00239 [Candidatus Steffania adelgidicola]|nr:hypothetical protein GFK82_00239 [Candidatus Steffania adelgidicola]
MCTDIYLMNIQWFSDFFSSIMNVSHHKQQIIFHVAINCGFILKNTPNRISNREMNAKIVIYYEIKEL